MNRVALRMLTALLPVSVLVGGLAPAFATPSASLPDADAAVTTVEATLADAGIPVAVPPLGDLTDVNAAIATVESMLAGLGVPALPGI